MTDIHPSLLEKMRAIRASHWANMAVCFGEHVDVVSRKDTLNMLLEYAHAHAEPGLTEFIQVEQALDTRINDTISRIEEQLEVTNTMLCVAFTRSAVQTLLDAGACVTYPFTLPRGEVWMR